MDFILKKVRLSHPTLFHAKEFKAGDGKPRWSASFIVEPGSANDKIIRDAISAEAKTTWGDKAAQQLKTMQGQSNKMAYLDGETKGKPEYEGRWVLSTHRAASQSRPLIIDRDKSPLTSDDGKPYGGCYVNAQVSIYCQAGENAGVRASFSVIQFVEDGDAFGAAPPSADGFDDLGAGADAAALM
jgi:hypothetical protein